jgi:hypothetical protein
LFVAYFGIHANPIWELADIAGTSHFLHFLLSNQDPMQGFSESHEERRSAFSIAGDASKWHVAVVRALSQIQTAM